MFSCHTLLSWLNQLRGVLLSPTVTLTSHWNKVSSPAGKIALTYGAAEFARSHRNPALICSIACTEYITESPVIFYHIITFNSNQFSSKTLSLDKLHHWVKELLLLLEFYKICLYDKYNSSVWQHKYVFSDKGTKYRFNSLSPEFHHVLFLKG